MDWVALNNKNLLITSLKVEQFKINVPVDLVYGRNPSWLADCYLHSEKERERERKTGAKERGSFVMGVEFQFCKMKWFWSSVAQ